MVELARLGGWELRYHTLRSKGSASGFPDWVFVRPPRILFVELKSEAGKVRDDQQAWIDGLNECGAALARFLELKIAPVEYGDPPRVQAVVWRPSDWDEIVKTLTGRKASTTRPSWRCPTLTTARSRSSKIQAKVSRSSGEQTTDREGELDVVVGAKGLRVHSLDIPAGELE